MKKLKLIIHLLSDLCSGSGDTHNSSVDTDVVYSSRGIPYIPGKALKGCIRESMLELMNFGLVKSKSFSYLFDKDGSCIQFPEGAFLKDHKNMEEDLRHSQYHPQEVLDLYTYKRKQTSINPETGAALKNHLRAKRVVRSGVEFECVVTITERFEESEDCEKAAEDLKNIVEDFKKAAENVVHIGINRTRGLGLIQVSVTDVSDDANNQQDSKMIFKTDATYILPYSIYVKSPVICKSPEGNQAKTQTFIDGGKMLGILAGNMPQDEFLEIMKESPIFSTAYIACGEKMDRATPAPLSMRKSKNASYDRKTGELKVYDFIEQEKNVKVENIDDSIPEGEKIDQLSGLGDLYITDSGEAIEVDTEIHYHHQRPDDKSIGHATGSGDNSSFYQLDSIREEQVFKGFIISNGKAMGGFDNDEGKRIRGIYPCLNEVHDARIGYSKNTQYGEVVLSFEEPRKIEPSPNMMSGEILVKVNSPIIMYDEVGMYVSDKKTFLSYLALSLGVAESNLEIEKSVVVYETIGGFNVTQRCRKPIFTAIGRGSIFRIKMINPVPEKDTLFIGERTSEGYGELRIFSPRADELKIVDAEKISSDSTKEPCEYKTNIKMELDKNRRKKEMIRLAQSAADSRWEKIAGNSGEEDFDPAIAKLILMYRNRASFDVLKADVEEIRKNKIKETAKKILDLRQDAQNNEDSEIWMVFSQTNGTAEEFYGLFLKAYLNEWKTLLRINRDERRSKNG